MVLSATFTGCYAFDRLAAGNPRHLETTPMQIGRQRAISQATSRLKGDHQEESTYAQTH
jgi:hypothetical protein